MKKALCFLLALVLCLGLTLPASAEPADEQLKKVTLQVKKTLEIGDDYTEFNGNSYVLGEQTWWQLSWTKENEGLWVTCDDSGKVFSFSRWLADEDYSYSDRLHFPDFTRETAAGLAESFLARVLDGNEKVKLTEQKDSLRPSSRLYLNGLLALNGVDTEISVNLGFRTSDGMLVSFSRSDAEVFVAGDVPSATPALSPEEALPKFSGALTTDLSWAYTDDEAHEARLMYAVSLNWGAMVDAQTGELLYRRDGYRSASGGGKNYADAEAAMDEAEPILTPQELAGADKYVGVLTAEELKAAALKEPAFGLTAEYEVGAVTYLTAQASVDPATLAEGEEPDDTVTASYKLSKTLTGPEFGLSAKEFQSLLDEGYTPTVVKYITADARTGEVQSLYTSYSGFGWREDKGEEPGALSSAAKDFLERRYAAYMPLCELQSTYRSAWSVAVDSFSYIRMEAGYPCPMNAVSVSVNAATGFVDSFSCTWDEELTFGPSGPVVGEEAAGEAFLSCYSARLTYVLLPEDTQDWQSPCRWLLVSLPECDGWVSRVDAVTGEPDLQTRSGGDRSIAYTDLDRSYAKGEIEKLAAYGVGFYGVTEFEPRAAVTELDMLLFMLSATGWQLDYSEYVNADEAALTYIYREAKARGFIASLEQNPGRTVTRSELCHCFVGLSGLVEAAEMRGIYRCGFTDEETIPEADLGYVAIAKGLGVVQGDAAGAFRPQDGATRQELAVMLYRYLSK